MAPRRLDYRTWSENGYYEHASMRGIEMKTVREADCLVQEFFGELKTNRGEMVGVGTERYGGDLKRYIGEGITEDMKREIENLIKALAATDYPEIYACGVRTITTPQEGLMEIEIELETAYGIVLRVLQLSRGC